MNKRRFQSSKAKDAPTEDQKEQQRDPDLQSYTPGGGASKASDPERNIIIEDDKRYEKRKSED